MSESRQRILQRLRAIQRQDAGGPESEVERRDWDRRQRIERFTQCMTEVRAEVHPCTTDDWAERLVAILQQKQVRRLLHAADKPDAARLVSALDPDAIEALAYSREIEAWKTELFQQVDAGFTSCRGAIAETGSLILWPDETEPRLLSLVPPIHCVLLQAAEIFSTFAEAVEAQGWVEQGMPSNALLISGPSKSADIAQVLAYGVHGPKSLVVMLVQ
jgi:L-lactate dehydrogenase complex protein LldG